MLWFTHVPRVMRFERNHHRDLVHVEVDLGDFLLLYHFSQIRLGLRRELCEFVKGLGLQLISLVKLEKLGQILHELSLIVNLDLSGIKFGLVLHAIIFCGWTSPGLHVIRIFEVMSALTVYRRSRWLGDKARLA